MVLLLRVEGGEVVDLVYFRLVDWLRWMDGRVYSVGFISVIIEKIGYCKCCIWAGQSTDRLTIRVL